MRLLNSFRWRVTVGLVIVAFGITGLTVGPAQGAEGEAWVVPTFECLGVYYSRATDAGACQVWYRERGGSAWREGYPLVYDAREKQYRGALVGLTADTPYDIRVAAGGQQV